MTQNGILVSPAVNFNFDVPGELAAQVFDVNSCASIYIGRVFPGEQGCSQGYLQSTPSTVSRGVFTAYKKELKEVIKGEEKTKITWKA
jgi:hypothetical protein